MISQLQIKSAEKPLSFSVELHSPEETHQLARLFLQASGPGVRIGLSGDLAAGKTEFVRGFVAACGVKAEEVSSPSYVLQCVYELPESFGKFKQIQHWDWYRLASSYLPEEISDVRTSHEVLTLVEWPERIEAWELLEDCRIRLDFSEQADTRMASIRCRTPEFEQSLHTVFLTQGLLEL